jgi:hypothetical protein
MFDSALAFDRYRLEVIRSWPDSAVKDKLLASIQYSLRRNNRGREILGWRAGSGESDTGRLDAVDKPVHNLEPSTTSNARLLPEIEQVTSA